MLAPDDRRVLLEHLRPPLGYGLDAAIATTFTLDLTAAIIPPLALSSFNLPGVSDPVSALEAVRASADRVDIFCQGGNISIPSEAPALLAFAEPMIHELRRPPGHLFHPKVWFVRYSSEDEEDRYRLLVLSRNLTNDRSWDIVVRLDSDGMWKQKDRRNTGLATLINDLPGRSIRPITEARAERVRALAEAAHYVSWELPEGVLDYDFHYLTGKKTLDFSGRRHLVVSPFVNDAGIDLVAPDGVQVTVLSRAEELEKLSPEQLERVSAFVIDPMVGIDSDEDPEEPLPTSSASTEAAPPSTTLNLLAGLHAKMYVVEPHGHAQHALVRIGSANATGAAFGGNVEFLVEFRGPRKRFGVDAFLSEDAGLHQLLEAYTPTGGAAKDAEADELWEIENLLRRLSEIQHLLKVTTEPDAAAHAVTLSAGKPYELEAGWRASLELLTKPGEAFVLNGADAAAHTWPSVETADLTPFVCLHVTSPSGMKAGTVLLADLQGAPEDRLDVILARQIDTPEKFLRFLYLILSLGNPYLLSQLSHAGSGKGGHLLTSSSTGILELVLRALHDRPGALVDIERLVSRLRATEEGKSLLPAGFDEFWATVEQARATLVRRKR